MNIATGLWLTSDNNLYIAEEGNNRVRKIDLNTNIISTVAGGGGSGFGGDGGPVVSTNTKLKAPQGVYVDTNGVIFIADRSNNRIRYVVNGIINTYAGGGSRNIDGYVATDAYLHDPFDVKGDTLGNIFVPANNDKVKVVDYSSKIVTTYLSARDPRSLWLDYFSGRTIVGMYSTLGAAPLYVPPAPTLTPTASPSLSPTVRNDDEVEVFGASRVRFVSGETLTPLSVDTLAQAFHNISDNAQSTNITSMVLVGQSSPQSSSIRGGVRRGRSVSDQAIPSQPSYTHDISFSSRYVMTYHGSYSSSQVMSQKKTTIRQAIEGGKFESVLRYLARAKNATQLLNVSCREVTSLDSVIVSPASSSKSDNEGSLSTGALVGIVIGVIVLFLILVIVLYVIVKRRQKEIKSQKVNIDG